MNANLKEFTSAYIEALYFTDIDNPDQSDIEGDSELAPDTLLDIQADCRSFWRRFGCYITTETCSDAFRDSVTQAGHDFHMTRNGHGVGFWEDEWPGAYREMLTNGANGYGPFEVYQGDDGLIYS